MHPIGEYSRRRFSRRHEYPTGHPLPAEIPPSERDATHIRAFRRRVSNGGAATENMKECGRSSLFEGSSCGWGSDFGRRERPVGASPRRRFPHRLIYSAEHPLPAETSPSEKDTTHRPVPRRCVLNGGAATEKSGEISVLDMTLRHPPGIVSPFAKERGRSRRSLAPRRWTKPAVTTPAKPERPSGRRSGERRSGSMGRAADNV